MLQITRHWTSNKLGHYQLETCHGSVGDLPHRLITCHAQHHTQSCLGGFHSNDLSCTYHSQEQNVGNDFDKDCKLVPLNIFVQQIFYSPPDTKFQFYIESLSFTDIRDMCCIYGQTLLDLVFYCARTYVYYIHREKQIGTSGVHAPAIST